MTQRVLVWAAVSTQAQAADDLTSLPEQERSARALADQHGWRVIDVLRVPGHSRHYIDIHDASRDMLADGIDAFAKLMQHWQDADFDVLIVRDGNRFARTQTLHAYVTERTIATHARIYSLNDGWVDEHNYRMWIAMNGYSAASDIDRLVKASQAPKDRLAEKGLPAQGPSPWFLKVERSDLGRAVSASIDRSHQWLYDDLARLILDGVGWRQIEKELWQQGHGVEGRKWRIFAMHGSVFHPAWWGHSARNFSNPRAPHGGSRDIWVFDESASVPAAVKIWRNTHDPVWSGDQAEEIKAELLRRRRVLRGKALHGKSHRFTGLVLCGYCHTLMHHNDTSYQCRSYYGSRTAQTACDRSRSVPTRILQDYIHALLVRMIELNQPDMLIKADEGDDPLVRVAAIEAEIIRVEEQTRRLIVKQAEAQQSLSALYDEQIAHLGEHLAILQANLTEARLQWHERRTDGVQAAFDELRSYENLEQFWASGEYHVNQVLHRLMGRRRFVVIGKEVVGTALR